MDKSVRGAADAYGAGHTFFVYRTPLGRVTIGSDGAAVTQVAFGPVRFNGDLRATALTNRASSEVLEYLAGKRRSFDVPLRLEGTAFQRAVWDEVARIPYGQTRTYEEVARALGNPRALHAVGGACARNPVPILVPCHRVVGVGGRVGGYVADPSIKRFLIELEAGASGAGAV